MDMQSILILLFTFLLVLIKKLFLVKSSLSIRNEHSIFAAINITESYVSMRL